MKRLAKINGRQGKKLKKGQTVAFISVFISLGLAIMKGIVGYLFNSQVLIADAIHSAADLMTHAASGFGLWIASRKPVKPPVFPMGYTELKPLPVSWWGCLSSWRELTCSRKDAINYATSAR